jgi:hypothetical protein
MAKQTEISPKEVEERFLLQSLERLNTPEQRYIFTLIADLISMGLAAYKLPASKNPART